jgi:hypothetical protein
MSQVSIHTLEHLHEFIPGLLTLASADKQTVTPCEVLNSEQSL